VPLHYKKNIEKKIIISPQKFASAVGLALAAHQSFCLEQSNSLLYSFFFREKIHNLTANICFCCRISSCSSSGFLFRAELLLIFGRRLTLSL